MLFRSLTGSISPSFDKQSEEVFLVEVNRIRESNPDLVWVGLGAPRQEKWMAAASREVPAIFFGVGAAFDFLAGTKPRAPRWMQHCGMEWLFRLLSEPRRLWKRYWVALTQWVHPLYPRDKM